MSEKRVQGIEVGSLYSNYNKSSIIPFHIPLYNGGVNIVFEKHNDLSYLVLQHIALSIIEYLDTTESEVKIFDRSIKNNFKNLSVLGRLNIYSHYNRENMPRAFSDIKKSPDIVIITY